MELSKLEWMEWGKRYWYPHMKPADVAILERFIARFPDAFQKCAYSVPVGTGLAPEDFAAAGLSPAENYNYQRKIDVLGYAEGVYTIIELKPRASTAAVGQVKGYGTLFRRDYKHAGPLRLMIATDQLMPEMEFLAKNEGVNLIVV